MIRFLLVLLAFVSALLAFIFQETVLFVASGGLLMISVVLLLLQVREQSKRKNRLKLPNELTPEDELRARGVLEVRQKARMSGNPAAFAPSDAGSQPVSREELQQHGILGIREKTPDLEASSDFVDDSDRVVEAPSDLDDFTTHEAPPEEAGEPEIAWSSLVASEDEQPDQESIPDLFATPADERDLEEWAPSDIPDETVASSTHDETPETPTGEVIETHEEGETPSVDMDLPAEEELTVALEETTNTAEEVVVADDPETESHFVEEEVATEDDEQATSESTVDEEEAPTVESGLPMDAEPDEHEVVLPTADHPPSRRRVEVDAHLPALQTSLGAHTICLIDVDTESSVYRLRSIVSSGLVDHAGTEYPFAGFFLSDLLAETTVLTIEPSGLTLPDLRYHRDLVKMRHIVAAPVMKGGLPAAFLVAGFEDAVDGSCEQAVTRAAAFFSSLYALQDEHPSKGESPLVRAKRRPPSLRLVKSNPKSSQSRIIAEEMTRARGTSHPLALALVCLDKGDEISRSNEINVFQVEEWMRQCLEQITPDGRIEYLGELGYGIIQLRDVSDVEGWVRRAQYVFRNQHGPVDAHPIVGVAMLSDGHRDPEDLQADAVRALRAAYETGDSTILVG